MDVGSTCTNTTTDEEGLEREEVGEHETEEQQRQQQQLPYWLVNVPRSEWPAECPAYLKTASAKDVVTLATWDADYHRLTWGEMKDVVATNRLDDLQRIPSELRRYRQYMAGIVREYGSVMAFMLKERLRWRDLEPHSAIPFDCADDYRILYNDWPYGIDEKIVHLVVWTKPTFETDEVNGDLTLRVREQIQSFVHQAFMSEMPEERVLWFRNWAAIRSVNAVEHIHVMLYDPPKGFLKRITHGDVAQSERLAGNGESGSS